MTDRTHQQAEQAAPLTHSDTVHDAPDGAPRRADARRGGRPPVKADKRKSVVVSSRYSPAQYEAIVRRAAKAGVKPSALQHAATMGKRVVRETAPASDFELVRELKAIGINLNQLTRVANTTGQMPAGLSECLDQLTTIMITRMSRSAK
ncbi:MAG: MobC family plasmid mobilization relaxosome protein [Pseudomonadota bacterium]